MASSTRPEWDPMVSFSHMYNILLIEHCRKEFWPDPVYEARKEGPDHVPTFTATALVNKVTYHRSYVTPRRVDAEQSAAREALICIYSAAGKPLNICMLVHEAGLCKSMLFDYALHRGFSLPLFEFRYVETAETRPCFKCVITIDSTRFEGPSAANKKEAEKSASLFACMSIMNLIATVKDKGVKAPVKPTAN